MRVLMLVNWKVENCTSTPYDKQPPDYYVKGQDYWFFRYFADKPQVDVLDISSFPWLERFEKNTIRFYLWQALKAIPRLDKYDLIVSHGMQSGIAIALWRRVFKTKIKHVVFDIGSFASASESGFALKLMQFASKSIDGVIYHTSSQIDYYKKFFPWIVDKSQFIRFGTDLDFFSSDNLIQKRDKDSYILCVGYAKRDWDTLVKAYQALTIPISLRLVGHVNNQYRKIDGLEQLDFIPVTALKEHIFNAKLCVLPLECFNYSFGQMTLMQQMALGKCVIASRVPSLVDYGEDGKTVVFYNSGDPEDLKRRIEMVLEDDDMLQAIGMEAKRSLQKYCNEEKMAKNIERFFHKICCA